MSVGQMAFDQKALNGLKQKNMKKTVMEQKINSNLIQTSSNLVILSRILFLTII